MKSASASATPSKLDDALVTLESDKATMDVPSSVAGVVKEIRVALGDRISQGTVVAIVEANEAKPAAAAPAATAAVTAPAPEKPAAPVVALPPAQAPQAAPSPAPVAARQPVPARPCASSPANSAWTSARCRRPDRKAACSRRTLPFVKGVMQAGTAPAAAGAALGGELDLLPWPKVDFAKFGPVGATSPRTPSRRSPTRKPGAWRRD